MSSKKSILILGLDGVNRLAGMPSEITAEKILAGVEKSRDDANNAGWDADFFLFDHEDKAVLDKIITKLKEKTWDVVCIGGGVRLHVDVTGLFEDVTNAAVTYVSPPPKFVFQTLPQGLLERLKYQFPEKA